MSRLPFAVDVDADDLVPLALELQRQFARGRVLDGAGDDLLARRPHRQQAADRAC
jgi:hypothetical protein